jgi:cell wall-associated NlpC family hydrolase
MFTSTRSRIMSMSAAAIGGSLLLVASPAEAFASELESPAFAPNSQTSAILESSPAKINPPEQMTNFAPTLTDIQALDSQAPADQNALDAKAVAIAKEKAAAKKRAAAAKMPINIAKKYIGVRYKRGGTSPKTGFDCSGFTRYVYKAAGKSIPRTSSAQRHAGKTVSRKKARPGDLVWFTDFHHVAIYAGNGYIIDAPKAGKKVAKRKLWTRHVKYIRVAG